MADNATTPEVTIESLQAELTTAKADLATATEVIAGQKAELTGLEGKIAELQANPAAAPSFKFGKKTYEVHAKSFQVGKVEYTVADLLTDKELQKALVEKGVGFLIEKED